MMTDGDLEVRYSNSFMLICEYKNVLLLAQYYREINFYIIKLWIDNYI